MIINVAIAFDVPDICAIALSKNNFRLSGAIDLNDTSRNKLLVSGKYVA